jgi:hypothetical protein
MNHGMEKKRGWRQEPMVWLIIALPVSAVIAGLLTIWIASRTADTLVSDDYYKVGMAPLQHGERDRMAAALGVQAELIGQPGALRVRLAGRFDSAPQRLELLLAHPARAAEDVRLDLTEIGPGLFETALPDLIAAGKRRVVLSAEDPAGWRLTGEWRAPFHGTLLLVPTNPDSSTRP